MAACVFHEPRAGFYGPSLDCEHRCLHLSSRQAHPQYLGQVKWRVRSGQLKRDQRIVSRSRIRTQPHGRGCTSQLYRCGSANPADLGAGSGCLCTREPLYRLVLSAPSVSNLTVPRGVLVRNQEWPFFDGSTAKSRQRRLMWVEAACMTQKQPPVSHFPMARDDGRQSARPMVSPEGKANRYRHERHGHHESCGAAGDSGDLPCAIFALCHR